MARTASASGRIARPSHFVYIVRCADGTLYTGYARDPRARLQTHNRGRGARYTAGRRPVRLVYVEACASRRAALRREYAVKQLSRRGKRALIAAADVAAARTALTSATIPDDRTPEGDRRGPARFAVERSRTRRPARRGRGRARR